jgi:hypothetical protein
MVTWPPLAIHHPQKTQSAGLKSYPLRPALSIFQGQTTFRPSAESFAKDWGRKEAAKRGLTLAEASQKIAANEL